MPLSQLTFVDQEDRVAPALDAIADLAAVGVDVERADWDRYYRAAALIQVGGAGRVVVIDPLAVDNLTALDAFLGSRIAVFHAIENDLDPLVTLDVRPADLRDTAVAAAVLGLPTGLEGLLRELLGVEIPGDKSAMQRANWEARPLTSQMLHYAAGDVADLPELWDVLEAQLHASVRRSWYEQELAALLALPAVEDRRNWSRTKGAGRLDPQARARLRALWERRETLGRDTDTAPGRIASDALLVELAETPPQSVSSLHRRGLRRQAVRRFGEDLLSAVKEGETSAPEARRQGRPATDSDREMIDRLRQARAERARSLGIDAGVLCPSRTLSPAVLSDPQTPQQLREALDLRDWQWEQLGAVFCEILGLHGPDVPEAPTDPTAKEDDD